MKIQSTAALAFALLLAFSPMLTLRAQTNTLPSSDNAGIGAMGPCWVPPGVEIGAPPIPARRRRQTSLAR